MSWTIKRKAEQEKEERSNEKANGKNDPRLYSSLAKLELILIVCSLALSVVDRVHMVIFCLFLHKLEGLKVSFFLFLTLE